MIVWRMLPGRISIGFIIILSLPIIQGCDKAQWTDEVQPIVYFPTSLTMLNDTTLNNLNSELMARRMLVGVGAEHVYIFDHQAAAIFQMDRSFRPIRTLGRFGQGPGEFSQRVQQLLVTEQYVIAVDAGNLRAVIYDHDGRHRVDRKLGEFSLSVSPFVWDESRSRLLYFAPSAVNNRTLSITEINPFSRVKWGGIRSFHLDKESPTNHYLAYTSLAGLRGKLLYFVENHIDSSPARQNSYEVYYLNDGSLVMGGGIFDNHMLTRLTAYYDDVYWEKHERLDRGFGITICPFSYIWVVNDYFIVCFVKIAQSDGNVDLELLGVDLTTGSVRALPSAPLRGKQIQAIAGTADSTLFAVYLQNDQTRILSAQLAFLP